MKYLNKRLLTLLFCCLLPVCCVLFPAAESVVNQVNLGKIKAAETKIFSFDTELTAWSTARVHTIDVQNAKEGSGCYSVTYNSNATTHQIVGSNVGAFDLNIKDVQHTSLMIELYVSNYGLVAPLYSHSAPMLVAQLHDINGRVLQWEIPCTYNGWNSLELQLWNTDSTIQEEAAFNFNRVVKFAITGTVYSGLTLKFDHLRLVDYTDTYQRNGAPYNGRIIADFDQGSLEGIAFDKATGYYNDEKNQFVNGVSGWTDYLRMEQENGSSVVLRGLSIPVDLSNDVFCFALYLDDPADVSYAKIVLEDAGIKLSVTEKSVLNAYTNGGKGLQKGLNLVRIPLSKMTRSGTSLTMTLRRVSLTLYRATNQPVSSQTPSQPNNSSETESQKNSQEKESSSPTVAAFNISSTSAAAEATSSSTVSQTNDDTVQSVIFYTVDRMYLTTQELLKGEAEPYGTAPGMGTPCELKMIYSNPTENSISASSASLITGNTATISIYVAGSYDVLQAGIYWGEVSYNLDYRTPANIQNLQNKLITVDLLGLKPQKTYFFQAYIMTEKGETRGEVLSFTTTTGLTVTTRCTAGGTVTPTGVTTVKQGENLSVIITPDSGYYLASLTVDDVLTTYGKDDGITQYTFTNISTGHVLYAQFEPLEITPSPTVSATPSSPQDTNDDSQTEDNLLKILLWVILSIAILSIVLMLLLPLLSKRKKDDQIDSDENETDNSLNETIEASFADTEIDAVVLDTVQPESLPQETLSASDPIYDVASVESPTPEQTPDFTAVEPLIPEQIPEVAAVEPPAPTIVPIDSFRVDDLPEEDDLSDGFKVNLPFEEDEEEL